MNKIIHLSDLHAGFPNLLGRLNQIVTNIIFLKTPASDYVIVISGDLVDDATHDGLYELVLTEIARLRTAGFTLLTCPGNHDYGTGSWGDKSFVDKFKRVFQRAPDVEYPIVDVLGETAFIGLDSMAEELHWYDRMFAEGELGEDQLGSLDALLKNNPVQASKYRVVYLHHHPFEPRPFHGLKDSKKLGEVIAGKVDCLLFGHNHDGKCWNGIWDIPRCYDAGSSTRKEWGNPKKLSPHRVMDLDRDARLDYDGNFH